MGLKVVLFCWSQFLAGRSFSRSLYKWIWRECCRAGIHQHSHKHLQRPGCFRPPGGMSRKLLSSSNSYRNCLVFLFTWWDIQTQQRSLTQDKGLRAYSVEALLSGHTFWQNDIMMKSVTNCQCPRKVVVNVVCKSVIYMVSSTKHFSCRRSVCF